MQENPQSIPGTVLWIAPFYNRSGYGIGARASVLALHRAGVRIRTCSSKEIDPGIDDCDLDLIRSLETTPLIAPVTAIVSHVPNRLWATMELPEPSLRILATTFDSTAQGNLPPSEWIEVCHKLDQIWLMSEKERDAFIAAGLPPEKIQIVWWPHPWLENPVVPPVVPEPTANGKPFRFLSIAMFQPRRRWDTLIEAYLEEFKDNRSVELYLKVNYPSWHPIAGKPRQDLYDLIDSLRKKTGSEAMITVDEELGTRMGIVNLMDSCSVYVSTDTTATAPISEARARHRMVIIPDGLHLGRIGVCIAVDPDAKSRITPDMLLYQPHHAGAFMPGLHVQDVRTAMRRAYDMTPSQRQATADEFSGLPGPAQIVPMILNAVNTGWAYREALTKEKQAKLAGRRITWEGSHFVSHSLALINRELCLQLIEAGFELSLLTGNEVDDIDPASDRRFEKIAQRLRRPLSGGPDLTVRHHWPPNFTPPEKGHFVMILPWEYGRLPEAWVGPLANLVDEIWVPSRHVLRTCIASGIPADRVQVVSNGVDPDRFHPGAAGHAIHSSKKFKFLFVGGGLWRKGVDILLDAYRSVFNSRDDVVLVLKDLPQQSIYIDQGLADIISRIRTDPSAPEILHLQAALRPEELPGLYTGCDCLVHPYRGEGFGLPVLEAMACGVPVITTEGGSTDDFCPPDQVFLIPAGRREFKPKDIALSSGGGWVLEPDWRALGTLMREVFENRAAAKERAMKFSERVRANYDWKKVADIAAARIDAICAKPVRRVL